MANVKYQTAPVDEGYSVDEEQSNFRNQRPSKSSKNGPVGADTVLNRSKTIFCHSIFSSFFMLILAGLPISMIVVGSIYRKQCTIERFIPLWLIIYGTCATGIALFRALLNIWVFFKRRTNENYKIEGMDIFTSIISFFLFGWFIAGNYWVYHNDKRVHYNIKGNPNFYCHKICFEFAFWSITATWILIGVSCLSCCCVGLVGICMAKKLSKR